MTNNEAEALKLQCAVLRLHVSTRAGTSDLNKIFGNKELQLFLSQHMIFNTDHYPRKWICSSKNQSAFNSY